MRRVLRRDKKKGQVPKAPEGPEDDATDQRSVQPLQAWQRETAPPYLFEHRSSGEKEDGACYHV